MPRIPFFSRTVAATCVLAMLAPSADACTSFLLRSADNGFVYGRTMEFGVPLQSQFIVVPRKLEVRGTGPDGAAGTGLAWTTKYGATGANGFGLSVLIDGMNEAGLSASLSFGGRTISGDGFGIPLVVRYVLEVAQTTAEAIKLLQRVPVSMCYSVTLLDRHGDWATVFVSPDRTTEVTRRQAITNFQHEVEWSKHAQATNAQQRFDSLQQQMDAQGTLGDAIETLLSSPMYQSAYLRGYGTLYTAVYRPQSMHIELFWPGQRWAQTLPGFEAGSRLVSFTNQLAVEVPAQHSSAS